MNQVIHVLWVLLPEKENLTELSPLFVLLSRDERQTLERYRVEFKKFEFLVGRAMTKLWIKQYVGPVMDNLDVLFKKNEYGKLLVDESSLPPGIEPVHLG